MFKFEIKSEDETTARRQLASDLGLSEEDLKLTAVHEKTFTFESLSCPPVVELDISRDHMKVFLKRMKRPIGDKAPKLTTDFVLQELKRKGVTFGIKVELITETLFKAFSAPKFDENKIYNLIIAQGEDPIPAQTGRAQWVVDLKLFEKEKAVYAKKAEVVARAPLASPGRPGMNVKGEPIPFTVEDSFKLPIGKGIRIEAKEKETVYITEAAGELFLDQGIRLRLETRVIDIGEGLKAAIDIGEKSFSGKKFTGEEIVESVKLAGISFGVLTPQEISSQLNSAKKWPARILVARGREPKNGQAGKVDFVYKKPASNSEVDVEKAKRGVVFPGEIIVEIPMPTLPEDGMTVFGEVLRGRTYNEQPIYPGKNASRERLEGKDVIKATTYGVVKIDQDRIHVENLLEVSKDASKASLELFPQQLLKWEDVQLLLRDKDVLAGFRKELVEAQLLQIHKSAKRSVIVLANSVPPRAGKNAKLRYYFRPEEMKETGLLIKSKPKPIFAAPGDILLEKILPVDAEDGMSIYREKIPAPKEMIPIDVKITVGKNIIDKEVGTLTDDKDPRRIQYRAATFGIVTWKDRSLDLLPLLEVDPKENFIRVQIAPRSDFGTPITFDLIQKMATEEGVRVDLDRAAIEQALKAPRPEDGSLTSVEIARATTASNGEDAKIEYRVAYNGEDIDKLLASGAPPEEPKILDCVRPKDILAVKTPAGSGQDGKTVFGRRINAERGLDLPWQSGPGTARSPDGNQLIADLKCPGFVTIEDRRIVVVNTVEVAADRMSAKMMIYPSKNARYQPTEEKIFEMIEGRGVRAGLKVEAIRQAIDETRVTAEPREVIIAEGIPASVGKDAQYRPAFAVDAGAGQVREDGSIDFKATGIFQMVKSGQLLLIKTPATRGADGLNVLDERLPGQMGADRTINAGEGVRVSANNLEYYSTRDGIVEFTAKTIRVIEGLYIQGDVDFSTGNIQAGPARVLIRGSILPGFSVSSDSEVIIDKVAEACTIHSGDKLSVKGGIIGKDKAQVYAAVGIETLYINSGATVESKGDIVSDNEVLNSFVRTGGRLLCEKGAGAISGGEIWAFGGVQARTIGAQGSEQSTLIHLGVNYLELQQAKTRIKDEGLDVKEQDLKAQLKELEKELLAVYNEIPEASKRGNEEAQQLQARYRELLESKKEIDRSLEVVTKQMNVILNSIPQNKDFQVLVREIIHPGATFIYKDVIWELKEPLRGVVITWNSSSSNFMSRRL